MLDPASNTMRSGVHKDTLGDALSDADIAWIYQSPSVHWDLETLARVVEPSSSMPPVTTTWSS